VGDVLKENGDLYGAGVNPAARICCLAAAGTTFTTGNVSKRNTDMNVEFNSRGACEVKGLSGHIPVFEIR